MCPRKPRKPCSVRGCPQLTEGRYCEEHQKQVDTEYNKTSRPFKHLYNTSRWKKLRLQFLQEQPLCVECKSKGVIKAATDLDHIQAHKGDEELFWNINNLQALCHSCHSRKTARDDGRWGKKGRVYSYNDI
ncbi:HNH endonuclease [Clostridium cellulovorans]|uniref:Putative HNH nuclease YajD n=1 Tax=Clostridium cellulovorans (strain ATCC 35296 / DSM 3052 / OCM 3 / 743B) TaxID=573061 RepID=D9SSE3_CLOC7|nr:HNH endonuclease signature motif containing protein [Clostridium cellulovorans]ADL50540.1 HNH endonuclease [Clostridium cellulovorans 743B]